jgi:hypothetical protein
VATLTNFRDAVTAYISMGQDATKLALMDGWINEGVADVLLRTGCKVAKATMTLTAGTDDYELSTSILQVKTIYASTTSDDLPFEQVSEVDIVRLRRAAGGSGSASRYYALAGGNLLMIYPTPDAADVLTVYYVPRPATLTAGGDTPSEIPAEYHKAVRFYALGEAADYDDDKSAQEGDRYRALYQMELQKMRKYLSRKGNLRLGRAVVGRRRPVPAHPSSDV